MNHITSALAIIGVGAFIYDPVGFGRAFGLAVSSFMAAAGLR